MTPELTILVLATLLWSLQFLLYLAVGHGKMDLSHAMGPRDTPLEKPDVCGRLHRALANHTEGLVLFAIAALVVTYADKGSGITAAFSALYLIARVLYVPAYAFGWTPWRTIIWMVGFLATNFLLVWALI
ncbi:MAG: MAPEG family protein [Pelagimonas sp.]|jgi:uncharacterized MAPEG superfamily protein|nr:MAPEG family protein [Pelagimonas sp.]